MTNFGSISMHNDSNLINPNGKLTITIPNIDIKTKKFEICHREALQKAYTDKIGETVDFCGVKKIIVNVRITDEFIFLDLE